MRSGHDGVLQALPPLTHQYRSAAIPGLCHIAIPPTTATNAVPLINHRCAELAIVRCTSPTTLRGTNQTIMIELLVMVARLQDAAAESARRHTGAAHHALGPSARSVVHDGRSPDGSPGSYRRGSRLADHEPLSMGCHDNGRRFRARRHAAARQHDPLSPRVRRCHHARNGHRLPSGGRSAAAGADRG